MSISFYLSIYIASAEDSDTNSVLRKHGYKPQRSRKYEIYFYTEFTRLIIVSVSNLYIIIYLRVLIEYQSAVNSKELFNGSPRCVVNNDSSDAWPGYYYSTAAMIETH